MNSRICIMEYGKHTGHQDKGFLFQDVLDLMKWISLISPKYIISIDLQSACFNTHFCCIYGTRINYLHNVLILEHTYILKTTPKHNVFKQFLHVCTSAGKLFSNSEQENMETELTHLCKELHVKQAGLIIHSFIVS